MEHWKSKLLRPFKRQQQQTPWSVPSTFSIDKAWYALPIGNDFDASIESIKSHIPHLSKTETIFSGSVYPWERFGVYYLPIQGYQQCSHQIRMGMLLSQLAIAAVKDQLLLSLLQAPAVSQKSDMSLAQMLEEIEFSYPQLLIDTPAALGEKQFSLSSVDKAALQTRIKARNSSLKRQGERANQGLPQRLSAAENINGGSDREKLLALSRQRVQSHSNRQQSVPLSKAELDSIDKITVGGIWSHVSEEQLRYLAKHNKIMSNAAPHQGIASEGGVFVRVNLTGDAIKICWSLEQKAPALAFSEKIKEVVLESQNKQVTIVVNHPFDVAIEQFKHAIAQPLLPEKIEIEWINTHNQIGGAGDLTTLAGFLYATHLKQTTEHVLLTDLKRFIAQF